MPHVPSLPDQIARRVLARFTALTGASTANLNGEIATIIGLVSDELSLIDRTFSEEFVRAHWFEGNPELVLQRLRDMPLRFPRPQPAKAAVGGAVTLTRASVTEEVTYPPNTIGIYDNETPDLLFLNTSPVLFNVGVGTVTDVMFASIVPGAQATKEIGTVRYVSFSMDGNIISAINTAAFVGRDAETVEQASSRARLWMASMAQSQKEALVSVARNFVDPSGATIINAHCANDPEVRGISYLTIDDGAGMVGYEADANTTTGRFADLVDGLRHLLMFSDYPAATNPKLRVDTTTYTASNRAFTCLNETGELWLAPRPERFGMTFSPGDIWHIEGYRKYTGVIANLQKYVNRFCVASGGRCIVRPPVAQNVNISGIIVTGTGNGLVRSRILAACTRAATAYIRALNMGQPFLQHELHQELSKVEGVRNYIPDQGDIYPGGPFYKLVPVPNNINFR